MTPEEDIMKLLKDNPEYELCNGGEVKYFEGGE